MPACLAGFPTAIVVHRPGAFGSVHDTGSGRRDQKAERGFPDQRFFFFADSLIFRDRGPDGRRHCGDGLLRRDSSSQELVWVVCGLDM
jgi:hypothetical protein